MVTKQSLREYFHKRFNHPAYQVDDIIIGEPFAIHLDEPLKKDQPNTAVLGKINNGKIDAILKYAYYRPVFIVKDIDLQIKYDDESQLIKVLLADYLSRYFESDITLFEQALSEETRTVGELLNPYSPVTRFPLLINDYGIYVSVNIVFVPDKLDVKYIFNDLITIEESLKYVSVSDRVKSEDKGIVWKKLKDKIESETE